MGYTRFFSNYPNRQVGIELDPSNKFNGEITLEHLGLIPSFINNGNVIEDGFKQGFESQYNFGKLYSMKGGHVTKEGKYVFRGDPDLYPLAVYKSPTETSYQYEYGIVAIVSNDNSKETFVTRMD